MSELTVAVADGDATRRGRQIGRAFDSLINRSLEFYHRYFERRGISSPELQDLLTPHLAAAETSMPELLATVSGMAEGAMVPFMELFAINAFEELEPLLKPVDGKPLFLETKEGHVNSREHCSTFTVAGPGFGLLGHSEQWLAGDKGNVGVVIERSGNGRTAIASPTIVGCLPAVGMNAHGGAQGIQSLTASDDTAGVPRVLVSRHALEARNRQDAEERTGLMGRAGGYGFTYLFRGGDAFTVETTATRESVLDGPGPHTNHYTDPGLAELGPSPSEGSRARYDRLQLLLKERSIETPEAVMEVLRDHGSAPQSICLHPDEAEGDEAEGVVFSMVCDVEAARMWVAPGLPCQTPFEEVDLGGLV